MNNIYAIVALFFVLWQNGCSQPIEPDKESGLALAFVDKDGNTIETLGKERPTDLYLKVISEPENGIEVRNLKISSVCSAVDLGSLQVNLTEKDEKTGFLNAKPIKAVVLPECFPGQDLAEIVVTLEMEDETTGEFNKIEFSKIYEIISLGDLPELMVVGYKINGLANQPAVLFNESWEVEVTVKNIGRRDIVNGQFEYSVGRTGDASGVKTVLGKEDISLAMGKSKRIKIPGDFLIAQERRISDEVVLTINWTVKSEAYSNGATQLTIPVQRGLVVKDLLVELMTKQSEESIVYKDEIPLDFVLENESALTLPSGRIWIDQVIGADLLPGRASIKMRSINPGEKILVANGLLSIKPNHDLLTLSENARIEVILKWQLADQEIKSVSLFIKRVEGELWQAAN